jgi:uncharacterized delta-60 repeat protein
MRYWKISSICIVAFFGLVGIHAEAYFSIGSGFDNVVPSTAVQSDEKILIGGQFTALNSSTTVPDRFIRLNSDGSVDTTFSSNIGTGFDGVVYAIATTSDDKILVGGTFNSLNGSTTDPRKFMRLNTDGSVDTTFSSNIGTGFDGDVYKITVQSDGKILVGGIFSEFNGSTTIPDNFIRLNSDGSLDTSFLANIGSGFNSEVFAFTVQTDDKILVGGDFTSLNGSTTVPDRLLRLNSDGTVDTTFSSNIGSGFDGTVRDLILQSDDQIIVGGDFTSLNASNTITDSLVRLSGNGTVDTTFLGNIGAGFNGEILTLAIQSDGKILVGGYFTALSGSSAIPDNLLRLNSVGTVDTTFSSSLGTGFIEAGGFNEYIQTITVQSDEKILVGGYFVQLDGMATATPDYLARLNSDGTIDLDAPADITILGSNPASLTVGDSYSDAGATATDISDGTVTEDIVTTNSVNANVAGSYTVIYNVTDNNDNTTSATRTVTVSAESSGGSSSGGGGGGGGSKCKKAVTKAGTLKTLAQSLATAPDLKKGDTAPTVKTLQQFLNGIGCTIAKKGETSLGNETTEFTSLTATMLKKFQKLNSIKPADGTLNSATRAYIKNTYAQGVTINTTDKAALLQTLLAQLTILQAELAKLKGTPLPKTTIPTTNVTALAKILATAPDMTLDTIHPTVKTLQQFLNATGYTVATNDFGAPGRETTTFWHSAQNALKKYQTAHGIPATGVFDQATRDVIKVKYVN